MHFVFVCLWLLSTHADANDFDGTEEEMAQLIEVLGAFCALEFVKNVTECTHQ